MFTRFKNQIISKIKDIIAIELTENLEKYLWLQNLKELDNLRKKTYSNIDNYISFGNGSYIKVEGQPKKINIGNNVACRNYCNFLVFDHASLIIEKDVFFNNYCSVNCLHEIEIGENTIFGENIKIYDHNHLYAKEDGELKIVREKFSYGKVKIGKNCWIGSNVTILKGVEIGDNTIIGAHNLIFKSIPSHSIIKANTSYTTSI